MLDQAERLENVGRESEIISRKSTGSIKDKLRDKMALQYAFAFILAMLAYAAYPCGAFRNSPNSTRDACFLAFCLLAVANFYIGCLIFYRLWHFNDSPIIILLQPEYDGFRRYFLGINLKTAK